METGYIQVEVQPTYKVEQKVYNIGYTPTDEELTYSGNIDYLFDGRNEWILRNFEKRISYRDITSGRSAFHKVDIDTIPDFNVSAPRRATIYLSNMFQQSTIKHLPRITFDNEDCSVQITYFCNAAFYLREVPDDYFQGWIIGAWSDDVFTLCNSLRHIPSSFFDILKIFVEKNTFYGDMQSFNNDYTLDEIINYPVVLKGALTYNRMAEICFYCHRLKDFVFRLDDNGEPYTVEWKNQTFRLAPNVGYSIDKNRILNYNSGITADKEVSDDATYNALKDNPDWFTLDKSYSRYNHDSALRTINSLPDCSAYVASGGTNTIIFEAEAGSKTDGGACGALTAEEIAVASAKGWTVSFV